MKIIDLLNKIAKGEEVPKKIRYQANSHKMDLYTYNEYTGDYHREIGIDLFKDLFSKERILSFLNDEVEIIEEDKKIKILPIIEEDELFVANLEINQTRRKINEIIDYLNNKEK